MSNQAFALLVLGVGAIILFIDAVLPYLRPGPGAPGEVVTLGLALTLIGFVMDLRARREKEERGTRRRD